jgi:hypothetical protein
VLAGLGGHELDLNHLTPLQEIRGGGGPRCPRCPGVPVVRGIERGGLEAGASLRLCLQAGRAAVGVGCVCVWVGVGGGGVGGMSEGWARQVADVNARLRCI